VHLTHGDIDAMIRVFETVAEAGLIRLPVDVPPTAHCVVTVLDDDLETLREQARLELLEQAQRRMSELLLKNRDCALTTDESRELDRFGRTVRRRHVKQGACAGSAGPDERPIVA
jgi:site-specific recombinase XerC